MNSRQAICKRIEELCSREGISYYNLAYKAAIPKSTLMNIFHKTNPTVSTINKICGGFGITLAEFFSTDYFEDCEEE